ncbi:MAG: hypothetical protein ACE5Z5_11160 [Candidatus Bathyarchaeia archaeon]
MSQGKLLVRLSGVAAEVLNELVRRGIILDQVGGCQGRDLEARPAFRAQAI